MTDTIRPEMAQSNIHMATFNPNLPTVHMNPVPAPIML